MIGFSFRDWQDDYYDGQDSYWDFDYIVKDNAYIVFEDEDEFYEWLEGENLK